MAAPQSGQQAMDQTLAQVRGADIERRRRLDASRQAPNACGAPTACYTPSDRDTNSHRFNGRTLWNPKDAHEDRFVPYPMACIGHRHASGGKAMDRCAGEIHATVLERWWGIDSRPVLAGRFPTLPVLHV